MLTKRLAALPVRLLLALAVPLAVLLGEPAQADPMPAPQPEAPLPGSNEISGLQVAQDADGRWMATFNYFYTGEPRGAFLTVGPQARDEKTESARVHVVGRNFPAKRGPQQVSIEVHRPSGRHDAFATQQVVAEMRTYDGPVASQQVMQAIAWPTYQDWARERELVGKTPDEVLARAVALIDTGDRRTLQEAKRLLEEMLTKNARFDPAYVELARVAMKTKWGPEGLHEAENLLQSALQIRPDSVNAKILLGYVYAHQDRYARAEALFAESAATDTKNLWLWVNWGEVLAMQDKIEPAKRKYREAIDRPRSHDTYDRAKLDAYRRLLAILSFKQDLDGVEALYKKRAGEFGAEDCEAADYARFMLQVRGDTKAAIELSRQAVKSSCESADPSAREVLAMSHYMEWATGTGAGRDDALNRARVFMPAGPQLLYLLCTSDRTAVAAQQLKSAGEAVDQLDNRRYSALALALERQDHATAGRLLRLGANPQLLVGRDKMPVAWIPALASDFEGIKLMQRSGVDYTKLRVEGMTAIDYVRSMGDRRLIEALSKAHPV